MGTGKLILLISLLSFGISAQETRGTITGTVSDQQGAVVPGVKVKIVNTATNAATNTITNESGIYVAPFIASATTR